MKIVSILIFVLFMSKLNAEEKMKMLFNNEEITKVIEVYSKISGQKFIVDPTVRGRISIFIQKPVSIQEAFNQLSSALAINGYAISKQGDTMVVKTARNIQRDFIEVSNEIPLLKPERMYTWIYTPKNLSAESISRELRILPSKDGEFSVFSGTNKIIFTDWVSNIHRIASILKDLDIKLDQATVEMLETSKRNQEKQKKIFTEKKENENE
ncbi:MAG: general secretion pathway protein GspD [Bdellovibrionaceae bacterium]|nr:general secretion pathway protein GspD [Pseudobdellovibrionaceae bacterium]NUM57587.1 general secretion pathway protein GspD [Pseudobdellovibrionaceae bacterium]